MRPRDAACGGAGGEPRAGPAELREAGADAVYADPAELLERFADSLLGRITP